MGSIGVFGRRIDPENGQRPKGWGRVTDPRGCCTREVKSSTAEAEAMGAIPGLVTVHIWSRVRSLRDYDNESLKPTGRW